MVNSCLPLHWLLDILNVCIACCQSSITDNQSIAIIYIIDSLSLSSLGDTEDTSESDDTAMLIQSPPEKSQAEECHPAQVRITNLASDLYLKQFKY